MGSQEKEPRNDRWWPLHNNNLVFIDTEYADPISMKLISLGAVSVKGSRFYAESAGVSYAECSDFVKEIVLPLLDNRSSLDQHEMAEQFACWIERQPGQCSLVADHACDIKIIDRLFKSTGRFPRNLSDRALEVLLPYSAYDQANWIGEGIHADAVNLVENSVSEHFRHFPRHHALHDALGFRMAWSQYVSHPKVESRQLDDCLVLAHRLFTQN